MLIYSVVWKRATDYENYSFTFGFLTMHVLPRVALITFSRHDYQMIDYAQRILSSKTLFDYRL